MIKNLYKDRIEFLKQNRKIVLFTFILFFALFLGQIAFNLYFQSRLDNYQLIISNETSEQIIETKNYDEFREIMSTNQIKQMRYYFSTKTSLSLFFEIFLHNSLVAFESILFGITGIFPAFQLYANITSVNVIFFDSFIHGELFVLYAYLHGIIELPTAVLHMALGFIIFFSIFKKGNRKQNILNSYKEALLTYLFIIVPLLFISAIIEVLMGIQDYGVIFYFLWILGFGLVYYIIALIASRV